MQQAVCHNSAQFFLKWNFEGFSIIRNAISAYIYFSIYFFTIRQIEGDYIKDISFEGSGCAISKASSSVMTDELKGKSLAEAEELFKKFQGIITGKTEADFTGLDKLSVFAGVREFPVRVKCAALAWHTMLEAIQNNKQVASTE